MNELPEEVVYQLRITRLLAWDMYAGGVLSITHHPKNLEVNPNPLTIEQIAAIADAMLVERDKRFGV